MRPHLLLLPLAFVPFTMKAQGDEIPVKSAIQGVTVYLQGAMVERSASATLPSGGSTIVFTGLSPELDGMSIQARGKGEFSILAVEHRTNHLQPQERTAESEALEKRIKDLEHAYRSEENTKAVWDNEEQLLMKNWAVGGQQNGVSAAQLQGVNEYVRNRLTAVKQGQLVQQEKLTEINDELNKLRQQLQQLIGKPMAITGEILVHVDAPNSTTAKLDIKYTVRTASWRPAYDLSVEGPGGPVELLQKALITQRCGEDWTKVRTTLSSADPSAGNIMPALTPWYVQIQAQAYLETLSYGNVRGGQVPSAAPRKESFDAAEDMELPEATISMAGDVLRRTTTVEFVIDAPQNLPSDGKSHTVHLQEHRLNAIYRHYSTPKLDADAFLFAKVTGWEDLDLLPGQANVFFDGAFVGQSFLDPGQVRDTLDVSLGRDQGITITRTKRKAFCKKRMIGGRRVETISWELMIRNGKAEPVNIMVLDQFPVSRQSEVKVELEEDGGATVNKDKGELRWHLDLAPKESRTLVFTYTVEFPKDASVYLE
ncbi:MAG: mucoidy inhibitor MuiA family protein [Flavobacteriales bacterium]|nr:mucoidy inhibitor MuiA family protein [Flavobacteriales bacterium]